MWLETLKTRRKELNYTIKYISNEAKLPERTVSRIFSGETMSPGIDTLYGIAVVLGLTLDELVTGNNSVLGGKDYALLHEEYTNLTAEVERLNSELALVSAENSVLKDKVGVLTAENGILNLKIAHKDELISLHNYYIKLNAKNMSNYDDE